MLAREEVHIHPFVPRIVIISFKDYRIELVKLRNKLPWVGLAIWVILVVTFFMKEP